MHRAPRAVAAAAVALVALTACGKPSADDITAALVDDGAQESVARCVANEAVTSDLSTDSLDRLAQEGITDDNGDDVQYLEDDSAILQALITA
ncbi:MAG: hypothetical protein H0T54_03625, partial [Geodermatophilaceae bacterium]|nr:hypothetical protein [Geodermatophilaceae bacterium]